MKRYPLVFFFIFAYVLAWVPMAYYLVSGKDTFAGVSFFAPALSAFVISAATEGRAGVTSLISRLFIWRVNLKWYLIALFAPILLEVLAILTHRLLGNAAASIQFTDWIRRIPEQLPGLVLILFFLVLSSLGEEMGWRGYAMPGLQTRYGPVWSSLILGLLWGLWHLPTFWIPGTPQFGLPVPGYVLASTGYTFIYTCIHNGTKGSVLLAALYHGASNLTLTYGNAISPDVISDLYLTLPALAILVIVVCLISGSDGFIGRQSLPD
ncbi:MAG: CPBP family intramembrane metalloprotease [Anaerolineales bacterium]|nr:CPBP family intramembrane metalloprotease [Anaerolineales bacterium]